MTRELERPALSRSTLDRSAHRRAEPGLIGRLLAEPDTVVLELDGDRAPVVEAADGVRLALRAGPSTAAAEGSGGPMLLAFLGEDGAGRAHLLAGVPSSDGMRSVISGQRQATLREVGALLDDTEAGLLTTAVALANWHATHPRCSRCGEPTEPTAAGWSRTCPACAAEHYPRTDPAVIMAVVDDAGRILLGHQATWPQRRFSTLAGFVEPGESLEDAVRREVHEETGVRVGEVTYQGSQPWPFPSSLMLAFTAQGLSTAIEVDGDELAEARWWSREELALDVATEELLLPPPVSVARRLIEQWYGGPLRDTGGAWR